MENLRKRTNARLQKQNTGDYKKYVNKQRFISQTIFNKNFAAIHKIKPALTVGKPVYVVFSIFGLSKLLMCEFHYGYFKRKYNAKLLFRDTDSLVYEIKSKDISEDFHEDNNFLILVTFHEVQSSSIMLIKKVLAK